MVRASRFLPNRSRKRIGLTSYTTPRLGVSIVLDCERAIAEMRKERNRIIAKYNKVPAIKPTSQQTSETSLTKNDEMASTSQEVSLNGDGGHKAGGNSANIQAFSVSVSQVSPNENTNGIDKMDLEHATNNAANKTGPFG